MQMNLSIKAVLIERDGMTEEEAIGTIIDMRRQVQEGEDPEELLHELGLEPDYIFDLL